MYINLKNPKDYNRAIQFLKLANVEIYPDLQEKELNVTTIDVFHTYNYKCPHCENIYTESGSELKSHYNPETGLIQCPCGSELKPLIQHAETAIPYVIKSTETAEEVLRLSFKEDDAKRARELLHLAGIETYDLAPIEQALVYVEHVYEFSCPICNGFHMHETYHEDELSYKQGRVRCRYCDKTFKVRFKNDENVVLE